MQTYVLSRNAVRRAPALLGRKPPPDTVRSTTQRERSAEQNFNRALATDPDNARALCEFGLLRSKQGLTADAIAFFDQAIALSPNMARAHCGRAHLHHFRPDDPEFDTLKSLLERTGLKSPDHRTLLAALGKAHDDMGEYGSAFDFYDRMNAVARKARPFDMARYKQFIRLIEGASAIATSPVIPSLDGQRQYPRPIFVIGMTRSGKSLVEKLLTRHEDIAGVGEYRGMETAIETIRARHGIKQPYPFCLPYFSQQQLAEIRSVYLESLIPAADGAPYVVNSHPGNFILASLIARAIPEAKIIYCTRPPLDTCLFAYFKNYSNGNGYACDLATLGSYYEEKRRLGVFWQDTLQDRLLTVPYEALVQDPDNISPALFDYCGLRQPEKGRPTGLSDREVGHARHYRDHLQPLVRALGIN